MHVPHERPRRTLRPPADRALREPGHGDAVLAAYAPHDLARPVDRARTGAARAGVAGDARADRRPARAARSLRLGPRRRARTRVAPRRDGARPPLRRAGTV